MHHNASYTKIWKETQFSNIELGIGFASRRIVAMVRLQLRQNLTEEQREAVKQRVDNQPQTSRRETRKCHTVPGYSGFVRGYTAGEILALSAAVDTGSTGLFDPRNLLPSGPHMLRWHTMGSHWQGPFLPCNGGGCGAPCACGTACPNCLAFPRARVLPSQEDVYQPRNPFAGTVKWKTSALPNRWPGHLLARARAS